MSTLFFILLPFMASVLYGLCYVFLEKTLGLYINPVTFMVANLLCNAVVILSLIYWKQESVDFSQVAGHGMLMLVVFIAAAAPTLGWVMTIYSIKNTSALYTALAETSYPLFTLAFGLLIFGIKTPNFTTLAGGFLILVGAAIMIYGKNMDLESPAP